jgi:hypothetical protein
MRASLASSSKVKETVHESKKIERRINYKTLLPPSPRANPANGE